MDAAILPMDAAILPAPERCVPTSVAHDSGEPNYVDLQPFLLINRTCRIVTAFRASPFKKRVAQDSPVFPANGRVYRQRGSSTVSRRSKPSSRTALMGEQPNPWDRLQPQDATSRHRGAKPSRRYGLLGKMSLLSPGYLLSVEQRRFHKQPLDHYALLSHLLDL